MRESFCFSLNIFFAGSVFRFLVLVGKHMGLFGKRWRNVYFKLKKLEQYRVWGENSWKIVFRQERSPWYIPVYNPNCKNCNMPCNFLKNSWLWLRVLYCQIYGQGVTSVWLVCKKKSSEISKCNFSYIFLKEFHKPIVISTLLQFLNWIPTSRIVLSVFVGKAQNSWI